MFGFSFQSSALPVFPGSRSASTSASRSSSPTSPVETTRRPDWARMAPAQISAMCPPGPACRPGDRNCSATTTSPWLKFLLRSKPTSNGSVNANSGSGRRSIEATATSLPSSACICPPRKSRTAATAALWAAVIDQDDFGPAPARAGCRPSDALGENIRQAGVVHRVYIHQPARHAHP